MENKNLSEKFGFWNWFLVIFASFMFGGAVTDILKRIVLVILAVLFSNTFLDDVLHKLDISLIVQIIWIVLSVLIIKSRVKKFKGKNSDRSPKKLFIVGGIIAGIPIIIFVLATVMGFANL